MTGAVLLLTGCLVFLCLLLLSLNLRSAWHWRIKAGAILLTTVCALSFFVGLEQLLGWPSAATPPARFHFHAALVREPARSANPPQTGAIYLWLSPSRPRGETQDPPRAYAMPYSRALHEQVERARQQMQGGARVEGRARRSGDAAASQQVELYEAPPPVLPRKDPAPS